MFSADRFLWIVLLFLFPASLFSQAGSDVENFYQKAVEFYQEGELDKSEKIFSEVEEDVCSTQGLIEICISGKIYLADINRKNRKFESAEIYLAEAEEMIRGRLEGPHPLEVRLHRQRVYLYVDLTHFDKARKAADKALELAGKDELDEMSVARAYLAPAYLEDELGNYRKSFRYYVKAVETLEHLEGNREILRFLSLSYNNMGILQRRLGHGRDAMEYYEKGLEAARLLYGENHPEIGLLYNNMGGVYYGLGDYGQAADYFLRAVNIFRDHYGKYHIRVAGGYNNAGVSYLEMDDYERGSDMLERAQRIKVKLLGEEHLDTAIGYSNLAAIHLENKNYDAALDNYQKSLSVRKKIYGDNHPNLVTPYVKLGEFYSEIQEYSKARDHFQTALQITKIRLGENHPDIWEVTLKIGDTFEKEKDYENALEYYELAFTQIAEANKAESGSAFDAGQLSHPLLFIHAAKKVGDMNLQKFETEGDDTYLHVAVDYYSTATEIVDYLQHSYQSEASKLNLVDRNYSIFTNNIKACHKLYQKTGNKKWLDEIFQISEEGRSRIAVELLQNLEARNFAGVPDTILERETIINTKIADYYQKLHAEQEKGFEGDHQIIAAYRDSLFKARQMHAKLTDELEQNYTDYYQLKYDNTYVDRETVSNLLNDDETLVKYIVSEEEIYVLVLDNENISFHALGAPDSLSSQIETLREAVSANDVKEFSSHALALYEALMDPIMASINTESIIIVPDQMLYYLPFEMLLTGKPNGEGFYEMPFLIREKRISYVPSATILQKLTEKKSSDPKNLLAVAPFTDTVMLSSEQSGASRYITGLSPLPLTRYETREIAKIFRESQSIWNFLSPEKTEIITGRNATKSTIESINLNEFGYIHFATHAFVNEENPALSGIAFWSEDGENGVVYVNDIYNMKLNADLVTLGACETGLGDVYKGEGMIGFTRAFMYAGASNLLVSMWRVNDQPTANLMISFYRNVREGRSYSESLQLAKLDLINQPQFAAPRHWAAFLLQGR